MPRNAVPIARRLAPLLLVLCGSLSLAAGCASFGSRLEPPEVSLVNLAALPSEGFEQRFEITVRVVNPNAVPLAGDGLDVRLDLNGQRLGRALRSEPFEIPKLSDEVLTLVATTNLLDVFRQAIALPSAGGRLDYVLTGRMLLADSPRWLSFSREGSLAPQTLRR